MHFLCVLGGKRGGGTPRIQEENILLLSSQYHAQLTPAYSYSHESAFSVGQENNRTIISLGQALLQQALPATKFPASAGVLEAGWTPEPADAPKVRLRLDGQERDADLDSLREFGQRCTVFSAHIGLALLRFTSS